MFVGVNRDAAIEIIAQLSETYVGGAVVHAAASCLLAAIANATRRMAEIVAFDPAR